jgi:hypothetical protein
MSKEAVQLIIGKAILDADFRRCLFAAPEQALSGYKLTAAEKKRLLKVDSEALELMAKILGVSEPVSKRS